MCAALTQLDFLKSAHQPKKKPSLSSLFPLSSLPESLFVAAFESRGLWCVLITDWRADGHDMGWIREAVVPRGSTQCSTGGISDILYSQSMLALSTPTEVRLLAAVAG